MSLEQLLVTASRPKGSTPWPVSLPFYCALILEQSGEPLEEVLQQLNVSAEQFKMFVKMPAFNYAVKRFQQQIKEEQLTFKLRAQIMAEEWLVHDANRIMRDAEATSASKVELFKHVTHMAGYVPDKKVPEKSEGNEGGFRLQIVFSGVQDKVTDNSVLIEGEKV